MTETRGRRAPLAIVGPTASGKSAVAIELALRLNAEIINCDSVQVYTGIQIATAKTPLDERHGIPHHLMDFVNPRINYTAGQWAEDAARTLDEIDDRGNVAILAGGTGFYLRALRNPFFPSPPTDEKLRQRLSDIRELKGFEYMHRLLGRLDPESARHLFPRDWPRVQRAVEVRLQTGLTMSSQLAARRKPKSSASGLTIIGLNPDRSVLYERINARAATHFEQGLVEEVRGLLAEGVPADSNALGAHGYRRVVEYLRGARTLEGAVAQTKQDVRNYAKRQLTWFRREEGIRWFEGFGDDKGVQQRIFDFLDIK